VPAVRHPALDLDQPGLAFVPHRPVIELTQPPAVLPAGLPPQGEFPFDRRTATTGWPAWIHGPASRVVGEEAPG
jgi:hypothetical protein